MINMDFSVCQNYIGLYQNYDKKNLNFMGSYTISEDVSHNFNRKNINTREHLVYSIAELVENISKQAKGLEKIDNSSLALNINCDEKVFPTVARALFHLHHIRVEKVDHLPNPHHIILTWDEGMESNVQKETPDFTFTVRGLPGTYPCHKNILANKSPYFKNALHGNTTLFELDEKTLPESVKFLLSYIYDEVEEIPLYLTHKAILQLQNFSKMFGLVELEKKCIEILPLKPLVGNLAQEIINFLTNEGQKLSHEDYQTIHNLANKVDVKILREASRNKSDKKTIEAFSMEKWKIFSNFLMSGEKLQKIHEGIEAVNVAMDEKRGIFPERGHYLTEVSRLLNKFSQAYNLKLVEDIKIG